MIRHFIAALALTVAAAGVQAKTVVVNQVVDANVLENATSPGLYSGAPFTLAVGDTLVVNFSFLPGQAFSIVNPVSIGMQAVTSDWQDWITTQQQDSMAFLGLQGNAHDPAAKADHTDGYGILNFFYPYEFSDGSPGTVSYTGVQFETTILSYSNGVTEREFVNLNLFGSGDSVSVLAIAVPEPATALLALFGLAVLGSAVRKRHGK